MKTNYQILTELYPISQNNGARIIQSKIDKMQDHPSESRGHEIEAMSGIPFDYESADTGNGPKGNAAVDAFEREDDYYEDMQEER